MKFADWTKRDAAERAAWKMMAKQLTADEARRVMHAYLKHALESEARGQKIPARKLRKWLLKRGIWVSQLPKEGIEDMSVDPRPMFLDKDQGGALRKLKVEVEPLRGTG